jgi:predicted SprT family Zn-dependent metalloprotease
LRSASLEDRLLALRGNPKNKNLSRKAKKGILVYMKKKLEEQVIQKFPYRCPYCNQPISYNQLDLKKGENKIECPSCKKIYIKVVSEEKSEP